MSETTIRKNVKLPKHVLDLFWEYNKSKIAWQKDSNLIIEKVLSVGRWVSLKWILNTAGRDAVRQWLIQRQGGGLDEQKLRFWQIILGLPPQEVDKWVKKARLNPWGQRWNS